MYPPPSTTTTAGEDGGICHEDGDGGGTPHHGAIWYPICHHRCAALAEHQFHSYQQRQREFIDNNESIGKEDGIIFAIARGNAEGVLYHSPLSQAQSVQSFLLNSLTALIFALSQLPPFPSNAFCCSSSSQQNFELPAYSTS